MTANEILRDFDLSLDRASKAHVRAIYSAADDGGTIQPEQMVRLFRGQPTLHSTCSMRQALLAAGCSDRG